MTTTTELREPCALFTDAQSLARKISAHAVAARPGLPHSIVAQTLHVAWTLAHDLVHDGVAPRAVKLAVDRSSITLAVTDGRSVEDAARGAAALEETGASVSIAAAQAPAGSTLTVVIKVPPLQRLTSWLAALRRGHA